MNLDGRKLAESGLALSELFHRKTKKQVEVRRTEAEVKKHEPRNVKHCKRMFMFVDRLHVRSPQCPVTFANQSGR